MFERYIKFIEHKDFSPPSTQDHLLVEVMKRLEVKHEFQCKDDDDKYHSCYVYLKARCYITSCLIDYPTRTFKGYRNLSNTQHTIQYLAFEVDDEHDITDSHLKWVVRLTHHIQTSKELKKTFTPKSLIWERSDIVRWILLDK